MRKTKLSELRKIVIFTSRSLSIQLNLNHSWFCLAYDRLEDSFDLKVILFTSKYSRSSLSGHSRKQTAQLLKKPHLNSHTIQALYSRSTRKRTPS